MAEDDDVATIAGHLTSTSPVYVGTGASAWLDAAELAQLETAIRETGDPIFVVLVEPGPDAGSRPGQQLLTQLNQAGVPDGLYIGVDFVTQRVDGEAPYTPYTEYDQIRIATLQNARVADDRDLADEVELYLDYGADGGSGEPFELAEGLITLVELLGAPDPAAGVQEIYDAGHGGLTAANDQNVAEYRERQEDEHLATALGVGGAVLGAIVLGVVVARMRRALRGRSAATTSGTRGARRTFALPDAMLSRVREAEAAELRRRARAAVLALGEHIDATDLGAKDDTDAWQSALDHYEAAGRLAPDDGTTPDVLDAVGAIVLADRGEQALAAAGSRRRKWAFTTPCFLNPLHGPGSRGEPLVHGDFRVDAPVCTRCRRDLKAGRRPDILDVVVDGRAEHYFETDVEPWASSGFGALEPDLVTRLRTRASDPRDGRRGPA